MTIQEAIERLRQRTHVPLFVAEDVWDAGLDGELRGASAESLFSGFTVRDPRMAGCAIAGLHLWNDNFEASHHICQAIQTPTGSYWHALCHRREGRQGSGVDYNLSNARYWFRNTGDHPLYDMVYRSALSVLDNVAGSLDWANEAAAALRSRGQWDPTLLVEWFGQADAGKLHPEVQAVLEEIQWREIDLLLDWCIQQAISE